MSLSSIRSYFRTRLNSLGYSEWSNAFNDSNIPSTLMDMSYFLGPISTSPIKQNQADLDTNSSISIHLHYKGGRDPSDALDTAISQSEAVLLDVLKAENRIGSDIKNIQLVSVNHIPLDVTNDNIVRTEIAFNCRVIIGTT